MIVIDVAAIVLVRETVLVAKRAEGKHLAGHWEFPGGKIEQSGNLRVMTKA
jgi:8-oxo-dGTP diphosphatase